MPFPPLFLGSFPFLKPGEKKPSSLNEGQAKVMLGSHIPILLVTTTGSLGQGKGPLSSYLIPYCESWTSQALWGNLSPTTRNLHSVSAASGWHSSPSWQHSRFHQQWERFSEVQEEAEIFSSMAWNLSPMNFLQLWLIIGPPGGGEQGKDGRSQSFSMAS